MGPLRRRAVRQGMILGLSVLNGVYKFIGDRSPIQNYVSLSLVLNRDLKWRVSS